MAAALDKLVIIVLADVDAIVPEIVADVTVTELYVLCIELSWLVTELLTLDAVLPTVTPTLVVETTVPLDEVNVVEALATAVVNSEEVLAIVLDD